MTSSEFLVDTTPPDVGGIRTGPWYDMVSHSNAMVKFSFCKLQYASNFYRCPSPHFLKLYFFLSAESSFKFVLRINFPIEGKIDYNDLFRFI